MEWIKILGSSGLMLGVFGLVARMLGWKFSPVEKVNVKKIESDIRLDEANIHSKRLDDEIKVSQQALEWTAQFAAQLDKANAVIDKLQIELDKLRALNQKIQENYSEQIDKLEEALNNERKHCQEIKEELEKLRKKYGHG